MKKHILGLIGVLLITSCSPYSGTYSTTRYDYAIDSTYMGWQCSTGMVMAQDLRDMCMNLMNDPLNNYCAKEARMEIFRSNNCGQLLGVAGMSDPSGTLWWEF